MTYVCDVVDQVPHKFNKTANKKIIFIFVIRTIIHEFLF